MPPAAEAHRVFAADCNAVFPQSAGKLPVTAGDNTLYVILTAEPIVLMVFAGG